MTTNHFTMDHLAAEVSDARAAVRAANTAAYELLNQHPVGQRFRSTALVPFSVADAVASYIPLPSGAVTDQVEQSADMLTARVLLRADDAETQWMAAAADALNAVIDAARRHRRAAGLLQAMVDAIR
jgi:hypothetical protein